jgi:nicotinamide-nucleotide adenylyltransferase
MTTEPIPPVETGVIHGRFQVLHTDHLAYLLAGMTLCRHLVVGITNPDPLLTRDETVDPKRSNPSANPLTYYERYVMVRAVLEEAGIGSSRFSVVPFPINLPELYKYYVPLDGLFFLSVYDDWGKRKLEYFRSLGLATHVLREVSSAQKGLSATDIRQRMARKDPWEELVPPAAVTLMKKWDIPGRLRVMAGFP